MSCSSSDCILSEINTSVRYWQIANRTLASINHFILPNLFYFAELSSTVNKIDRQEPNRCTSGTSYMRKFTHKISTNAPKVQTTSRALMGSTLAYPQKSKIDAEKQSRQTHGQPTQAHVHMPSCWQLVQCVSTGCSLLLTTDFILGMKSEHIFWIG